jgi:hypothetical protein
LYDTEWIKVDDMPARVQNWDPQDSINKGRSILNSLRQFCRDETARKRDDDKVWRVEVRGGDPPNGCIRVTDAHPVFVRSLTPAEMAVLNRRRGRRMGIVTARFVDERRKK